MDGDGFVSLSVNLKYEPETGIVKGWQTICELDSAERKMVEHRLPDIIMCSRNETVREVNIRI